MDNLIATFDDYFIYKFDNNGVSFYLCVSSFNVDCYELYLGFPDKDFENKSREQVIDDIKNINDVVKGTNSNSVFAMLNIPVNELENAAFENDERKYNELFIKRIRPINNEIYRLLVSNNRDKSIYEKFRFLKRNDTDKKIAGWLAMKLGDRYIQEIDFEELKEEYMRHGLKNVGESVLVHDSTKLNTSINHQENFSSGIAPINRMHENTETVKKENILVRKKTKSDNKSFGFSSFKFMIFILVCAIFTGVIFAALSMK